MTQQPINLLGTLGLQNVAADPNDIPDNTYDGVVAESQYVTVESKDTLAHVITYRVADGPHKGAQRQEWFTIGNAPRDASGNFAKNVTDVVNFQQAMSDQQKMWYKKRWVDLGIAEADVNSGTVAPEALVGRPVTFGVKTKNGFKNISFVNLRKENPTAPMQQVNLAGGAIPGGVFPSTTAQAPGGQAPSGGMPPW